MLSAPASMSRVVSRVDECRIRSLSSRMARALTPLLTL
jgi:hypothetical protein